MSQPGASRIRLSPTQLAAVRRRIGDHGERTVVEACAVALAYWATGKGPDGMDLTPATPFPDLLGRAGSGTSRAQGWETDVRALGITVPPGVDPAAAQRALDDLADFPDRPLGTIGPSGPRDRAEELARWNDTRADRDRPAVMELFAEQARLRPDAVAIVDEHRSLTYRETARLSAQLAHHLIERGLGPEQVVGISLDRSADMVVGLLAVLRAGGAFVPLDPRWPAARRSVVAEDARIVLQLNATGKADAAEPDAVAVDLGDWKYGDRPTDAPDVTVPGGSLAYVIFTSGSTGRPKGAMIRHEAISERLLWQSREILRFGHDDASLFKAPLSFDISVNEIFLPLTTGGRLVVLRPGGERDPHHLLGVIEEQRVTFTYLVSSMLDVLLEIVGDSGRLDSLRHVWCGGEVLTPELYERFRTRLDIPLYHGYGPAETTIGVSHVIYRGPRHACRHRSARPTPTPSSTSSTTNCAPSRPASAANCTSGGSCWGAVTRARPASPPPASSPTPSPPTAPGSTAPATSRGTPRTDRWTSSAAPTTRSRSGACGWRSRTSRRASPNTPVYGTRASSRGRTRRAAPTWSATSSPRAGTRT